MSDLPQELVDELKGMSGKSHDCSIIKLPSESLMLKNAFPQMKRNRNCLDSVCMIGQVLMNQQLQQNVLIAKLPYFIVYLMSILQSIIPLVYCLLAYFCAKYCVVEQDPYRSM